VERWHEPVTTLRADCPKQPSHALESLSHRTICPNWKHDSLNEFDGNTSTAQHSDYVSRDVELYKLAICIVQARRKRDGRMGIPASRFTRAQSMNIGQRTFTGPMLVHIVAYSRIPPHRSINVTIQEVTPSVTEAVSVSGEHYIQPLLLAQSAKSSAEEKGDLRPLSFAFFAAMLCATSGSTSSRLAPQIASRPAEGVLGSCLSLISLRSR
jgi:hypothetical protein